MALGTWMAVSTWMAFGTLISVLPVLGIVAGLARVKFRRAPIVAGGLVILTFGIYVAALGIWAVQCRDCLVGTQNTRGEAFQSGAVFFGMIALATLLGIWLGARLTVVLRRLFGTMGELRDELGRADETGPSSQR